MGLQGASARGMIDTHAVLAEVVALMGSTPEGQSPLANGQLTWLREQMQQLPVVQNRDAEGNHVITLPGKLGRTVVLGSYLSGTGEDERLASCVGLVVGVETMKALAHRYSPEPSCGLELRVWTQPEAQNVALGQSAAAYLELQVEAGTQMQNAATPLAVVERMAGRDDVFHPRLRALCDEAIRELSGASATVAVGSVGRASEVAASGVPAAAMCVRSLDGFEDGQGTDASRLHLLQAAEAFGRWAEATMHLVAGEEVDLWAREDRVPHLG